MFSKTQLGVAAAVSSLTLLPSASAQVIDLVGESATQGFAQISRDGQNVAYRDQSIQDGDRAFRWDASTGPVELDASPFSIGINTDGSETYGIDLFDGGVFIYAPDGTRSQLDLNVGNIFFADQTGSAFVSDNGQFYVRRDGTTVDILPTSTSPDRQPAGAAGISGDGNVVIGTYLTQSSGSVGGSFAWSPDNTASFFEGVRLSDVNEDGSRFGGATSLNGSLATPAIFDASGNATPLTTGAFSNGTVDRLTTDGTAAIGSIYDNTGSVAALWVGEQLVSADRLLELATLNGSETGFAAIVAWGDVERVDDVLFLVGYGTTTGSEDDLVPFRLTVPVDVAIPEPAGLSALAAAGLLLRRRR